MIADHEAKERFEVISEMSAEIADLKAKLAAKETECVTAVFRAIEAEAQVRQLERQLTTPAREVKSLYSHVSREADQEKFDKELTRMTSAGWMLFDSGVIPGVDPARFVSLIRVAPLPAEPEKPAAAVAAAPTIPESRIVEPEPASTPGAIVAAAPTPRALSISTGEADFQRDLRESLAATAAHIARTNPFFGYEPTKFSDLMKGTVSP